jgi:hypothetical protein
VGSGFVSDEIGVANGPEPQGQPFLAVTTNGSLIRSSSRKKDERRKVKTVIEDPPLVEEKAPEPESDQDFPWGSCSTKRKKKLESATEDPPPVEENPPEPDPALGNTTSFDSTTGTTPKKDNKEKLVKPTEESREAPANDDSRGVRATTEKFHDVDPYGEVVLLLRNTGTSNAVWVTEN